MQLTNDFTVAAPPEEAWPVLLDIPRVAGCLPGASIEASSGDGVYRGRMTVKLGPITTAYGGTVRVQEVDEDERTVVLAIKAREQSGQGMASAVITNQLLAADGGTRVVATTDLTMAGAHAQFGSGMLEDIAGRMLAVFAERLEAEIASGGRASDEPQPAGDPAPTPATPAAPAGLVEHAPRPAAPAPAADEVLDLGAALMPRAAKPVAIGGIASVLALGLVAAARSRRRGFAIRMDYRW